MKPELRRIEATLHQLSDQGSVKRPRSSFSSGNRSYSFEVLRKSPAQSQSAMATLTVQPFPAEEQCPETPTLPKLKMPSFSSHQHAANPMLAINLLQEMQEMASGWHTELRQIIQQIQDLYLEGPIVDAWLECHSRPESEPESEPDGSKLRHAELDALMGYVEEICNLPEPNVTCESPRSGYHLCGLDANGQLWSRPCPPEQVPSVGLAIARYQKLRQLLGRKQQLEARLSQLAKALLALQGHLQTP